MEDNTCDAFQKLAAALPVLGGCRSSVFARLAHRANRRRLHLVRLQRRIRASYRIEVTNVTIGAVPEYVKLQGALYVDGTSSGIPEKIAQLVDRRRFALETLGTLLARLEKAQAAGTPKAAVVTDLKRWADSLRPAGKVKRNSQSAINRAAARSLIADTAASLDEHSLEQIVAALHTSETRAAASKAGNYPLLLRWRQAHMGASGPRKGIFPPSGSTPFYEPSFSLFCGRWAQMERRSYVDPF